MISKFLISYTIDSITNIIGYSDQTERDGAYRQYKEIGILTANGTAVHPDMICALDNVACASYRTIH